MLILNWVIGKKVEFKSFWIRVNNTWMINGFGKGLFFALILLLFKIRVIDFDVTVKLMFYVVKVSFGLEIFVVEDAVIQN